MPSISPVIILGKTIRRLARIRGGGTALPGLVLERMQPNFLKDALGQLPGGVVVVTGTNGKTTTTKMVVELLEANGLKVLTNKSGSNFTRGIAASVIEQVDMYGKLDHDIAVIELDEAYAKQFVAKVTPRIVITLNVMRDQLDRFGEVDMAARLLEPVILAASEMAIINGDDPQLLPIARKLPEGKVKYFSVSSKLSSMFPSDDQLKSQIKKKKPASKGSIILDSIERNKITYLVGQHTYSADFTISGLYNYQNAGAALATADFILKTVDMQNLVSQLALVKPAFGRGEQLLINGQPVELVLVKNPAGFRLSLQSFIKPGSQYMIAINDEYADGRDMSWLWDVDFSGLSSHGVSVVSGARAYDMALRLQYEEVLIGKVAPSIKSALQSFFGSSEPTSKVIFCTYTAMLKIRSEIKQYADNVERAL